MDVDSGAAGGAGREGAGAGAGAEAGAATGAAAGADVRVRFVTKLDEYRVTETPFAVPARLTRRGLSEVVNHLLGRGEAASGDADDGERNAGDAVPFDFLVDGRFLRTSLAKHLRKNGMSGESIVTLEYAPAFRAPRQDRELPHPDWVGAVHGSAAFVASGCYDGSARLYDDAGSVVATVGGVHTRPIRGVCVSEAVAGCDVALATAAKDGTLRLFRGAAHGDKVRLRASLTFTGHANSVDAVAIDPLGSKLVSGSWDGALKLWSTAAEGEEAGAGAGAAKRTRRRDGDAGGDAGEERRVGALATASEHTQSVCAVCWQSPVAVASGSHDHSVRLWALGRGDLELAATLHGNKVVTGLAASPNGAALATSHPDSAVRLWDPRAGGAAVVTHVLRGHGAWVSAVAWAPFTDFLLATASHDATVRLWDIRASRPLHTMGSHGDKALAVAWQGGAGDAPKYAVSGGADKQLRRFALHGDDARDA